MIFTEKAKQQRLKKRQENNPFNRIVAKNLHNAVLGQKLKGNIKRPGHSISRSIEKRKQSLLQEYKAIETNKFNTFIDKRYEKTLDSKLSKLNNKKVNRDKKHIEAMIKKLTSQRLKSNKKVSFNLDDDYSGSYTLTHLGAPINDETIKQSNRGIDFDQDDDNKYLYKGFNKKNIYKMIKDKNMSFEQIADSAGISLNKNENKTRPQIIKQQILRSRYLKCKQQIDNEAMMDETDLVDSKFKETKDWLFANRANNKNNDNDNNTNDKIYGFYQNNEKALKQKKLDLEYQKILLEFQKDARSGVTDRTITDLQKAKKNYELLTIMEKKRKRKQLGLPSDSDDDDDLDIDLYDDDKNKKNKKDKSYDFVQDDANMEKLEEMFDRAQKGYDQDDDDKDNQDIDIIDGDTKETNWEKILEQVAEEDADDENDIDDDEENKIFDEEDKKGNHEEDGYDAEIDEQFMPRKKKMFDEEDLSDISDDDFEIGAEPAGEGEQNVFDKAKETELKKKEKQKQEKLKKKLAATHDFDIESEKRNIRKKGVKRKRSNINDDVEWNILDLDEDQDLTGHGLNDIPFTLEIPESIQEFEELMSDKTPSQQITLLKRMRNTNHVKLNEKNKNKIIRLYDMLLDYFRKLCINYEPTKTTNTKIGALQKDIGFYQYVDVVTRALFALSHDIPEYAYSTHIKKLETISIHIQRNYNLKHEKQFKESIDDNDNNDGQYISYMPSGYALFYLKLVSYIFPKSNKANPVISSVLLILCKSITDIPINGPRDVSCYIFCITLILDIIKNEKRYVPEVMHSLHNLLRAGFLSDDKLKKTSFDLLKETDDLYFTFRTNSNIWNDLDQIKNFDLTQMTLPIRWIFVKNNGDDIFKTEQFKIQSLYSTLTLIFKCHEIWKSFLAYSEIFKPFYKLLSKEEGDKHIIQSINESNSMLSDLNNNLCKCLKESIHIQSMTRKPLQLIHRARSIPSLEPEFDPDLKPTFLRLKVKNVRALEKKQKRILKKAIKKQQKAVMNEFRKDTEFIQRQKTMDRISADNKRHAKWQHEWHNLTEQQRDTNAFQMVGKKLRKRLMKKGVIRGHSY